LLGKGVPALGMRGQCDRFLIRLKGRSLLLALYQ
jgi:hypothetical protein